MNAFSIRNLGRTNIELSAFGLGGTAIGGLYEAVNEDDGVMTVAHAYNRGIRYFDTAPFYGHGSSERRFGSALKLHPRHSYVLSSKVGRLLKPVETGHRQPGRFEDTEPYEAIFDYSRDGVLRSIESSLKRLNIEQIDILLIHDVKTAEQYTAVMNGAYPALDDFRKQGLVKAIGVGVSVWEICRDFALNADFDCFLLSSRYTLLEHKGPLFGFLPICQQKGIGVIIGAPFNSGILATGSRPGAMYNYEPADSKILKRVADIEHVCQRHGVMLASAALQFPLGHPVVASVISGARSIDEVNQNILSMEHKIPVEFWAELKAEKLIEETAPIDGHREKPI